MIRFRPIPLLPILAAATMIASCEKPDNTTTLPEKEPDKTEEVKEGTVYASLTSLSAKTKTSYSQSGKEVGMLWSDSDKLTILTSDGKSETLSLCDGKGTSKGTFGPSSIGFSTSSKYYAFYPAGKNIANLSDISISFENQSIKGFGDLSSLKDYDYIYGSASGSSNGTISFDLKHASSIIGIETGLSTSDKITSVDMMRESGEILYSASFDLTSSKITEGSSTKVLSTSVAKSSPSEGKSSLWMAMVPQDLSSEELHVILKSDSDELYTGRISSEKFSSDKAYYYDRKFQKFSNDDYSGSDYSISEGKQKILDPLIESSLSSSISSAALHQLSAISLIEKIGSNYKFALVTDKAKGPGILILDITITDDLDISDARLSALEGTLSSTISRDPEGLVKVGDKYWVSGEGHQDILEYDSQGNPTGRSLEIPDDMLSSAIQNNLGFEALAYDGRTIWTTTENALSEDLDYNPSPLYGNLLRIQGFDPETCKATERHFYLMDSPKVNPNSNSTYVHGVSEITALPDRKLVVLEREVYVSASAMTAQTENKLYLIDPENDPGGILSKSLLIDFKTENYAVANYEGMCCITLEDNSNALILVNDSQGKMTYQGHTLNDYIKIIRL